MTEQQSKIGKRFAILDIMLVGPMALPGLSHFILSVFIMIDHALGLQSPLAEIKEPGIMFANVVGVLAVMWAIARLRVPHIQLMKVDAYARIIVGLLLCYYWALLGPSAIFILFLLSEFGGATVQLINLRQSRT